MLDHNKLYKQSLIQIRRKGEAEVLHELRHFFVYNWVDHSIVCPSEEALLKKLIQNMGESLIKCPTQPIVVHCSAGIGRTGTLISLCQLFNEYKLSLQEKEEFRFSVYDTVLRLRHMRAFMVQTASQYIFIHSFLYKYLAE